MLEIFVPETRSKIHNTLKDLAVVGEFIIKNPNGIIEEVQGLTSRWTRISMILEIPSKIINTISIDFVKLRKECVKR